jgi:hypothetical protein
MAPDELIVAFERKFVSPVDLRILVVASRSESELNGRSPLEPVDREEAAVKIAAVRGECVDLVR